MNARKRVLGPLAIVLTVLAGVFFPVRGQQSRPMPMPMPPQGPASAASTPTGSGLIVGQVVDGSSNSPVGGAIVVLQFAGGPVGVGPGAAPAGPAAPRAGIPASNNSQRVMADGSGRFVFHDLPRGAFQLSASAPGYMPGGYGQLRPGGGTRAIALDEGQRIPNAICRLWKYATVSGTIIDETGEPVVTAGVRLLRRQIVGGQRWMQTVGAAQTDDRGAYRFSDQQPGDYLVVVPATTTSLPVSTIDDYMSQINAPRPPGAPAPVQALLRDLQSSGAPQPSGNGYRVGNSQLQPSGPLAQAAPPPIGGHLLIYPTTFYPGAGNSAQAQVITIASGEDHAGVDFPLRMTPTVAVSGQVIGPDGPAANMGVRLIPAYADGWNTESGFDTAATATDGNGAFTLLGVVPGTYLAKVVRAPARSIDGVTMDVTTNSARNVSPTPPAAPTLWAEASVAVNDSDVNGVLLNLREGLRVSGRVEFDGSSPRPGPTQLPLITIQLTPTDGQNPIGVSQAVRLTADGQFATPGLLPGRYVVTTTLMSGWTLRGAMLDGHDVSQVPLTLEGDVSGVVITFTDRPTRLTGSVILDSPKDVPPTVVIFPAAYQSWIDAGMSGRPSRTLRPNANKMFTVSGMPAGDYLVAAVPDELASNWQDPATIEAIARVASRVTLAESAPTSVQLREVVIR